MTLEQFIKQPSILREEIMNRREKLETLRVCSKQLTPYLSGMPKSMNLESRLERYVIRMDELEREIEDLKARKTLYNAELQFLFSWVEEPNCRKVLIDHYIHFVPYNNLASEMNYSESQIYRFRNKGLKEVEKYYREEESKMRVD